MTWHIDPTTIARYVDGAAGDVASDSVEAHLAECADCRRTLEGAVGAERREHIWVGLRDLVDRPTPRLGESVLEHVGVPHHTARLLTLTPSIRPSWLLSMAIVLSVALVASPTLDGGPLLFLVIAPLVPVMGVAASFGRRVDPGYEVGLASPTGGFPLMLIRAAAVLAASVVVTAVPSLLLTEVRWMVVWLLPALAVTVLTLILSTVVATPVAAWIVSVLWVVAVFAIERTAATPLTVFAPPAQVAFGLLAAGSIAILLVRRSAFERS